MTVYAKEQRRKSFENAREALALARESKREKRERYLSIVAFWRNNAAYYIRDPGIVRADS